MRGKGAPFSQKNDQCPSHKSLSNIPSLLLPEMGYWGIKAAKFKEKIIEIINNKMSQFSRKYFLPAAHIFTRIKNSLKIKLTISEI